MPPRGVPRTSRRSRRSTSHPARRPGGATSTRGPPAPAPTRRRSARRSASSSRREPAHGRHCERRTAGREPFDEAYARGITEELPGRRVAPGRCRRRPSRCTAPSSRPTGRGRAATSPSRRARSTASRSSKPTDVRGARDRRRHPAGLIDLHGHPEFNVFAAWEPPKLYANRYAWRRSKPYQALVRDPQNILLTQVPPKTQTRYAEVRALVGGVTGIQGASGASSASSEPLVRNVDQWAFGAHRARSMIDLPSGSFGLPRFAGGHEAASPPATSTRFYLHLSEGQRGDARERQGVPALPRPRRRDPGDEHHPRHRPHRRRPAHRRRARLPARLVAAVEPAPLRRDDARRRGARGRHARRARRRLAAVGLDEPARRDEGRAPRARPAGPPDRRRRPRRDGDLGGRPARRARRRTSARSRSAGRRPRRPRAAPRRPLRERLPRRPVVGRARLHRRRHHLWPRRLVRRSSPARRPARRSRTSSAWGKPMRLDTGFQGGGDVPVAHGRAHARSPAAYPAVGPIFA